MCPAGSKSLETDNLYCPKKARPSQTDRFKRSSLSTEEVGMQDKDRAGVAKDARQ